MNFTHRRYDRNHCETDQVGAAGASESVGDNGSGLWSSWRALQWCLSLVQVAAVDGYDERIFGIVVEEVWDGPE